MKRLGLLVSAAFCLSACATAPKATNEKIIDLSHPFDAQTIYWPTEDGFKLEKRADGVTEQGYYYAANAFAAPEHGGTHIDAPKHFSISSHTVDQIPLDQLIGDAILIDVTKQAEANRDYLISVDDFTNWEKANGQIPNGSIILLRTGFARFWPDRVKYMGTDERGAAAVAKLHFPGLSPEQIKYCLEKSAQAPGMQVKKPGTGEMVNLSDISVSGGVINAFEAAKVASTLKQDKKREKLLKSVLKNSKEN